MKIAFVHYHLRPGGVSTVIRQQIQALTGRAEMLLLTGEAPEEAPPVPTVVIPGLAYDSRGGKTGSPAQTAYAVRDAICARWPQGCDILHVHNPLLAKNTGFLDILSVLQQEGLRLLLQVHDFAEDGRPDVYHSGSPYPQNCHYCVINSRDRDHLLDAGLVPEGVHLLANMVRPFGLAPEKPLEERFVLYPVRAIRRKNIGEALLLSLFLEPGTRLAITLPPTSMRDQASYDGWREFANQQQLPVMFEAAGHYAFPELVASARTLVTTSITEGFGFAYLEPWTAGQLLVGRKLPGICRDFEENGLRLDHLYERLEVPLSAFDADALRARWKACIQENAAKFGLEMADGRIRESWQRLTRGGTMDFGLLDEAMQRQVITRILADRSLYRRVLEQNPPLSRLTGVADQQRRIRENR
ncbi:MAG TPA: hypothetical protein VKO20_04060, partial [Desulfosalsimonadaceae bacterium]|nr:hypothetical protein [Desulfosalsimonadaceae bacterium]